MIKCLHKHIKNYQSADTDFTAETSDLLETLREVGKNILRVAQITHISHLTNLVICPTGLHRRCVHANFAVCVDYFLDHRSHTLRNCLIQIWSFSGFWPDASSEND